MSFVTERDRYHPNIDKVDWDISKASKEERNKIKDGLVVGLTHSEEEYKAVLSYLHMKYPDLMDVYEGDGKRFQWCYKTFNNKLKVFDKIARESVDMYGIVYYDKERDYEPIAVGGSYFRLAGAIRNPRTHQTIPGQVMNQHTTQIRCGHGYRIFIDPDYRRLGLAQDQWITEAKFYRDCDVHYQKEVQTYEALKVTQSIFDNPDKCYILSNRNLSRLQKYENVKCIMDYFDGSLIRKYNQMPENLRNFRNPMNWRFLEREGLTIEELVEPWNRRWNSVEKKQTVINIEDGVATIYLDKTVTVGKKFKINKNCFTQKVLNYLETKNAEYVILVGDEQTTLLTSSLMYNELRPKWKLSVKNQKVKELLSSLNLHL